jgi:hypoxanthine-guanine phosphoribosyltransferase
MPFGRPPRTPWQGFPEVSILSTESTVKRHPEYAAAKGGDIASARRLIQSVVGERAYHGVEVALAGRTPVLVAVHAVEAEGINRIPAVLAEALAERLSLWAEPDIVQINRVGHTGATGWHRLAFPPLFDGAVEAGAHYVLVDDFVGQGGTLANLKGFIESRGGVAVLAVTLTGKRYSAKLAPSSETVRALRNRHGFALENWWLETFGFDFDRLTESEGRYLARAEDADTVRDRLVAARQEGDD